MRLVLMSDTHIPGRARRLPAVVLAAVAEADVVVHAGDWVGEQVLDELLGASRSLVGCVGNNDGPALRRRLPEVARTELDGVRIGVVHETGQATGRERRCDAAYPDLKLDSFLNDTGRQQLADAKTNACMLELLVKHDDRFSMLFQLIMVLRGV